MSLTPQTFYNEFEPGFLTAMGVDEDGMVNRVDEETGAPIFDLPIAAGGDFSLGQLFADAYEEYAKQGEILGIVPGSLSFNKQVLIDSFDMIDGSYPISTAIAKFWSSAEGDQIPAYGGVVPVSFENNAEGLDSLFEAALLASRIIGPDSSIVKPMYSVFIEAVEPVVKTIQWTFIELDALSSPVVGVGTIL